MEGEIIDNFTEKESKFLINRSKKIGRTKRGIASIMGQFSRKFGSDRFHEVRSILYKQIEELAEKYAPIADEKSAPKPVDGEPIPRQGDATNVEPSKTETPKPRKEEKKEPEFKNFWLEIERGFMALKKEFTVVYGFCITRPGLPSANFISYMIPHMSKLEEVVKNLFSDLENYNEQKFKLAIADFKGLQGDISSELESVQSQLQLMDPFDKLVDKFVRLMTSYIQFINTKMAEVVIKKKQERP